MLDFDEFFPFIIALIVGAFLFYGMITLVKKSMNPPPDLQPKIDANSQLMEQKWRMREIQQRQKQLMRDQQQKIRDLQRR